MLPDVYYERVHEAMTAAVVDGVSYADALDEAGLLATEERLREQRDGGLTILALMAEQERADSIVRWHFADSRPVTAAEMWTATQAWLNDSIDRIKERPVL